MRFDEARWQRVTDLAARLSDVLPHVSLETGDRERSRARWSSARGSSSSGTTSQAWAATQDARYLVASITKPVVAMATLLLIERGDLTLNDRVSHFLPEFARQGKIALELQHLLTHTSGLPDLPQNNWELRQRHAPLAEFVLAALEEPLLFPAGRAAQYSSLGFAVLGAVLEVVTQQSCAQFVARSLLAPLGMPRSTLGLPAGGSAGHGGVVPVLLPPEQVGGHAWNWNSDYWLTLGAPWGGLVTTAADLGRLARWCLGATSSQGMPPLTTTLRKRALSNRLGMFSAIADREVQTRGWGLGWRLNWPGHAASLGDLLPDTAVGHWGATGTLLWLQPDEGVYAIVLTNQANGYTRPMRQLSNAIAACWH